MDRVKEQVTKQGLERFVEQAGDLLQVDRRSGIDLRPHQREALNRWSELEHVGLFEMATGAGKTITAIQGILELEDKKKKPFRFSFLCLARHLSISGMKRFASFFLTNR